MKNKKIETETEKINNKINRLDAIYSSKQIGQDKILVNFMDFADQYGVSELPKNIQAKTKITDAFRSSYTDRLVIELEVK